MSNDWLPVVFMLLMGLAMLIYVVLDGYDLGVGILLRGASDDHKDTMIASIGPFWDANETWLVLGVGILLIAFPVAHGVILTSLYLPVAIMLVGLILRGVAFDFRVKAQANHKPWWNHAFFAGSLITALAQGVMLGLHVTGYVANAQNYAFAVAVGLCLSAGYVLLGATWLIMKTEGELQQRAVTWARHSLWGTGIGIALISVVTPLVSERIFDKWFSLPAFFLLLPIPLATAALFLAIHLALKSLSARWRAGNDAMSWLPFASAVAIFVLAFHGLAYSLFPYLVVDRIVVWEAASAPESLKFMLVGIAIVLPTIIGYTIFAYRVFWGKARELTYT